MRWPVLFVAVLITVGLLSLTALLGFELSVASLQLSRNALLGITLVSLGIAVTAMLITARRNQKKDEQTS